MLWIDKTSSPYLLDRLDTIDLNGFYGSFCHRAKGSRFKPSGPIKYGDLRRNACLSLDLNSGGDVDATSELTHGVNCSLHREDNLSRLEVLFAVLTILPFDEVAARRCGQLKTELEKQGKPLDDLDLQLARITLVYDLSLTTNNTKRFRRIKDLKIENWIRNTK